MHYYILILIILNHYKKLKQNKKEQGRTTYNGDNFQIFDIPNNKGKKTESWTDNQVSKIWIRPCTLLTAK
mgnify:CR=1 FL=1